jgi:hypothetical protein
MNAARALVPATWHFVAPRGTLFGFFARRRAFRDLHGWRLPFRENGARKSLIIPTGIIAFWPGGLRDGEVTVAVV